MTTHTLNGYEIAFPEFPEGATDVRLENGELFYKASFLGMPDIGRLKMLPPGDWQLLKLSEVSEELASGMVDSYEDSNDSSYDPMYNVTTYFTVYEDYLNGDDLDTAYASLTSWVRSKGVEGNPYLLIKKN